MTARDVQLGFLGGLDKGVGPIPLSICHGTNADLIAGIAPLYLAGSVLDVTYGRGMWWKRHRPDPFGFHDLALDGIDFRHLPHADRSWDTVCFDPPYVPRHGADDATHVRDQDFRHRYGLDESRSSTELRALLHDGLTEVTRVARTWVLVKCNDYTNGRQLHLGHVTMLRLAEDLGLRAHDLIVHASGTGPGGGQIHNVIRARRAHSYLLVLTHAPRRTRSEAAS